MERNQDSSWLKDWRVLTLCGSSVFAGFLIGLLIFGSPWHLPPAWGDIPTWITGIATTGLLAGAIITAVYAIRTFSGQARELVILAEQRDRDNAERRIAQAARVFTAIPRDSGMSSPAAKNASDLPAFDAEFWSSEPGGASGPDDLGVIRPGDTARGSLTWPHDEARARLILAFRDATSGTTATAPLPSRSPSRTQPTRNRQVPPGSNAWRLTPPGQSLG